VPCVPASPRRPFRSPASSPPPRTGDGGIFVGEVHRDRLRHLGELGVEHFLTAAHDEVAALAGGDAAEDEHVAEVVVVGIVGDGIAEVDADCLEDEARPLIALGHLLLDVGEAIGEGQALVDGDPGGRGKAEDGLLGEVVGAAADVS
jgi:hypothetical protein